MKLQFIGTGTGKTSLKRNHSSILISTSNHNLLIDAGDGISKALLSQNIHYNSINSILFTHYHADHFSGIAPLITQMKLTGRKNKLMIYTHHSLVNPLKYYLNTCYLFNEKLGFKLTIVGFNEEEENKICNEIQFTARINSHITKSEILINNYNYINFVSCSFCFEITSKKIKQSNKRIIYTSDIGSKDDLYLFKDKPADYFITETTHVSLEEIFECYKTQNPKRLFLTHIDDESEIIINEFISKLKPPDQRKFILVFDEYVILD